MGYERCGEWSPPWLYDGGLKDGGDSTGFSQNLYAQKKGGCSDIWNSVVNAWLWIQIGLISCVKVYTEGELYDAGLKDDGVLKEDGGLRASSKTIH